MTSIGMDEMDGFDGMDLNQTLTGWLLLLAAAGWLAGRCHLC